MYYYAKDNGAGTTQFCVKDDGTAGELCITGAGGGAPVGASYVVISLDGTLSDERTLAAGTGLALSDGGAGGAVTLSTASTEANFLTDGGGTSLTCGVGNGGKVQVLDDGTLEWCDGAATPALRVAAFGNATGQANNIAAGVVGSIALSTFLRTRTASISLADPATADDGKIQFEVPSSADATMIQVACNVDAATSVTIQLYERARATPESGTTGMLSSALVCDTDGAETGAFADSQIESNVPIALGITAVSGTPTWLRVHVRYSLN